MSYGTVFVYAALAMLTCAIFALLLLKKGGSGEDLTAEMRAEAAAGG